MIVGIDLGTSTSLVAAIKDGKPTLILNERGKTITPSVVGFSETGELLVGEAAKNQAVAHPDRTVSSIKRIMGTNQRVTLGGKEYTPQEVSALILAKLKRDAEAYFGQPVSEAVVTVPAYFTDAQRQATKDAGEIAGFQVERIINEPTAAALAYGFQHQKETKLILVYDFGGGTFDVSIIKMVEGAFKVLGSVGNNRLGGDDFDQIIADHLYSEFAKNEGVDLRNIEDEKMRLSIRQRILEAAEKAKIDLSTLLETTINIPFLYSHDDEPKHLDVTLTRADFESMTESLIEATREPVEQALEASGLTPEGIDSVILVGGTTRMPAVKRFVTELLEREPLTEIHPEECVAIGAAVQAGVKVGQLDDLVVVDVAPYTLGIEVVGDRFSPVIYANTAIPCSQKRRYVTVSDYQTEANIHVLQGNHKKATRNTSLGEFVLTGITPKPKGESVVEVIFDYDVNGIVNVTARDRDSGAKKNIIIKQSKERMGMEEKETARTMVSNIAFAPSSGRHAPDDEETIPFTATSDQSGKSSAQIEAEFYLNDARDFLSDKGSSLPSQMKAQIEETVRQLEQAISENNEDKIDKLSDTLLMQLSDADIAT
ncbi:MAG TPA: molecular chaperone DnaK [Firmicutes bacterium]|nr:molecular chaperone DnaK [Bacillota bacterium]